jgi:hypothetical protein
MGGATPLHQPGLPFPHRSLRALAAYLAGQTA